MASLDEADLRDLADGVRVLEGQLDAWIAAIDTNRTDIDAISEALELQGDIIGEIDVEVLADQLGTCG